DIVQLGQNLGALSWVPGTDSSSAVLNLLSGLLLTPLQQLQQMPVAFRADPYGHGTHVAAIAAGRGGFQSPDTGGVAPNANLYDVRVLDENGTGDLANVIAGIDWVIQHARPLGIRVMNLSLAAGSTDSVFVDPLARAARSAVASGLVVVAAAGN